MHSTMIVPNLSRRGGRGVLAVAAGLLACLTAPAATLLWDAVPTNAGPDDGAGSWGAAAGNTNWWDGSRNVAWTAGNTAVFGVNTATSATVTLTNSLLAGSIVYSNLGAGIYTLGAANNAVLAIAGSAPGIQFSGPNGTHVVNPPVAAPGGLAILGATTNTAAFLRLAAASNNIVGSLTLGTPGNASYATPTGLYVDFNNGTVANLLRSTTNVTVCSNATFRISGQNGSAYNLAFPKRITLGGDGQGGIRGAWLITGNAGGTFNADVVLAGDSTIMTSSGGGGAYTYTVTGTISGAGNLRLVNDSSYPTLPTLVLSGGPHTYSGTNTVIGGNLAVRLAGGPDRLPAGTALTLGVGSVANGATVTGFGKLILGDTSGPASQTLVVLADGGVPGSAVVGGNSSANSILTLNSVGPATFAGQLGGAAAPDNRLALVKNGASGLMLAGANQCAGGYTVNAGFLSFGGGIGDPSLTGPITNHATLIFNVATNLSYSDDIAGTGSIGKTGGGTLLLNGTSFCSGPFVVGNGTLGGNGVIAGPVSIQPGATLAPGIGIGLLTLSNALTLAGTTVMELNKLALTNDSVRGLASVTYGGTLMVSNLAGSYAVGDAFRLFQAGTYTGSFTNIVPAQPGPGRAWDTSTLTSDGTLRIVTNSTPNHPPAWTANPLTMPAAAASVAYAASLAGSVSDPDVGDSLTFSKLGGPAWLTVAADGTLSGTPGAADLGLNSFPVRAVDSGNLGADATLLVTVVADPNAPASLASPDGRLALTFAVSNFDGSVSCPTYAVARTGLVVMATSKLGLTFGGSPWRSSLTVTGRTNRSSDTTWGPVYGERSVIRDNYNEMVLTLQETVSLSRVVQLTFRAYNEGVALCYTIPAQAGLTMASGLTEQTEFRFPGNYPAWSVTSAQGNYSATSLGGLANGNERPLTVQLATNLFVALGEARLVDYARMKFNQLGVANSLVSALSSSVTGALPLRSPWRFVLVGDSPGRLLENNDLVLNLNEPCALADTSWIKPGKVIREVTLTTTGGLACVDFARQHRLDYVEFDAGWYGPENTTTDATRVNVDPARSPGPLDLQRVIDCGNSNGIGVILYVNQVALTPQIDILPALYRSWGVKGIKFGFVNVGSQADTTWLHAAIRKCATNQILVDAHDELRPSGYTRTYPNLMTLEGISGDETTPATAQDMTLLFSRMVAGAADHTVCYFDARVTNNWNCAYQLAKAVCFYSPWQFLYWYDRPTNSYNYLSGGNAMIAEVPELEFYDLLPTVWDYTRVLQGSIGQYAVIARRRGGDWFLGAMNAGTTRTLAVPLGFLAPDTDYVLHRYAFDPTLTNRTRVRITRSVVDASAVLQTALAASSGEAMRLTPVTASRFQSISVLGDGSVSLVATGKFTQPCSLWAGTNLLQSAPNWSLLNTGVFMGAPLYFNAGAAANHPRQFYLLSTP